MSSHLSSCPLIGHHVHHGIVNQTVFTYLGLADSEKQYILININYNKYFWLRQELKKC